MNTTPAIADGKCKGEITSAAVPVSLIPIKKGRGESLQQLKKKSLQKQALGGGEAQNILIMHQHIEWGRLRRQRASGETGTPLPLMHCPERIQKPIGESCKPDIHSQLARSQPDGVSVRSQPYMGRQIGYCCGGMNLKIPLTSV